MVYQKALCKSLEKLVGMFVYNDEDLRSRLRKILTENEKVLVSGLSQTHKEMMNKDKEGFVETFIDLISENLVVELPKPENTNMTNLAAEYEVYKAGLESVIDSVVSSEIFSEDITGVLSDHIETVKNVYKHFLLRQWCADNNYFPEAMKITNSSKKEVEVFMTAIVGHLTGTMSNSTELLTVMQKFKEAVGKDLATISGEGGEVSSSGGDSGGEGYGSGDEGGAEDDFDASLEF